MAASIAFDDGSGSQTITPAPSVSRFNGWRTPSRYQGEKANAWGDGKLYQWPGRLDHAAAFRLDHIPYTDQGKLEAFLLWANSGGDFTITIGNIAGDVYSEVQVAPGTEAEMSEPDPELLDYSLSMVVIDVSATPAPLICQYP